MPPVFSLKNQYRGVNAHLHSHYQAQGGWVGFHTLHLGDLYRALNGQLRSKGYVAKLEESVQIRRLGMASRKVDADVLMYDLDPLRPPASPAYSTANPTHAVQLPLLEALSEDDLSDKPFAAIGIYRLEPAQLVRGEPVAWLELLSPSNKGRSEDAEIYRSKRLDLLMAGVVFIELDYLHESPPTLPIIPRYRAGTGTSRLVYQSTAQSLTPHPYRILVLDPRPDFDEGRLWVYPIEVEMPIPMVTLPLNEGNHADFDFGAVYTQTFEQNFLGEDLDYRQLPANFDRYQPADQTRILNRMITVIEAAQNGIDLNTMFVQPQPPSSTLALADAHKRLEALIEKG